MIRIIVIDDHTLFRNGIRALLANVNAIQIVGEAGTGMEGVQLTRDLQPEVVLLDLKLPDISGLEAIKRLLRVHPAPKILVVSSSVHQEFLSRTLNTGALGYVTKDVTQEELTNAIKTVNKGLPFITSAIASQLALAKLDHKTHTFFGGLNAKEMEVLILTVKGVSPTEIGKRLHMSPKTVHSYRSRLFKKLDVDNNVGLTLLAIREGLMTMEEAGV